jgi:hypothetical protein
MALATLPPLSKSADARQPPGERGAAKSEKLARLRQDGIAQERMWQNLGRKTRQEQITKAMAMTHGSPLAVDQAAEYARSLTRLRRKYIFKEP